MRVLYGMTEMESPTYFEPLYPKYNNKDFIDFSESDLENMINIYEKV